MPSYSIRVNGETRTVEATETMPLLWVLRDLIGLTGTESEIQKVAKAYRVFYAKAPSEKPDDYLVNHSSFVYLMGPDGAYVALFRHQTDPKEMANAIAEFIAGRRKVSLNSR